MTAPDQQPADNKPPTEKSKSSTPAPSVDVLSVVAFDRDNPITGHRHTVVGVVVDSDDQALTVRPLGDHHFRVTRDEVSVVTAEDDEV